MKVTVTYTEDGALTPEELKASVKARVGGMAGVTISPDSNDPYHLMYFAAQELITVQQLDSFYDDSQELYHVKLKKFIEEAEDLARSAILQVIQDNETKMT